jgi:cytochrome c biogenesis protein CcdA
VADARTKWLKDVLLYTFSGAGTAMLAGTTLGGAGGWLPPGPLRRLGVPVVLLVAVLAACRELGWVRLPLPQPHRQTNDRWAKTCSRPVAATLWGLDLGLVVTTRFTLAGVWVLVLLPVLLADAVLGATVLLAYWLGRALPVWLGPLLVDDANATDCSLDRIGTHQRLFQRVHVLGLVLICIALLST